MSNVTLGLKIDVDAMQQVMRIADAIFRDFSPERIAELEKLSEAELQEVANEIIRSIMARPQFAHIISVAEVSDAEET